jgi:hypothetical protein
MLDAEWEGCPMAATANLDGLAALGLLLGDPPRPEAEEVLPASCLDCKRPVWNWPGGICVEGWALTFDLLHIGPDTFLALHECHFDTERGLDR